MEAGRWYANSAANFTSLHLSVALNHSNIYGSVALKTPETYFLIFFYKKFKELLLKKKSLLLYILRKTDTPWES